MKKHWVKMLCAVLAMGLAGCNKTETPIVDPIDPVGGETGYLGFQINYAGGTSTRAWGDDNNHAFNAGSENEYVLAGEQSAHRAFFFTSDGAFHSASMLMYLNGPTDSGNHKHDGVYADQEKFYAAVARRGVNDEDVEAAWPSYVLIVLNGRPSRLDKIESELEGDLTMNGLLQRWTAKKLESGETLEEEGIIAFYKIGDTNYFTMTSSSFVDSNGDLQTATAITEANFALTAEEAMQNPVTVYVERVAAKFEVTFGKDADHFGGDSGNVSFVFKSEIDQKFDDGSGTVKDVPWAVRVTGWGINALEMQTYLFKNLENQGGNYTTSSNAYANIPVSFGQEYENMFSNNFIWNGYDLHRSYWAVDGNYTTGEYPNQFRQPLENHSGKAFQEGDNYDWTFGENGDYEDPYADNYPWALDYNSFERMNNQSTYRYSVENTFGGEIKGYDYMIKGTHVLVAAELLLGEEADAVDEGAETVQRSTAPSDKYRVEGTFYTLNGYIAAQFGTIVRNLAVDDRTVKNIGAYPDDTDGHVASFTIFKAGGGLWFKKESDQTYTKLTAEHFTTAPAYLVGSDGKVTISLNLPEGAKVYAAPYVTGEGPDEQPNFVQADGSTPVTPQEITRNMMLSMIYTFTQPADHFNEGKMYYAIPVKHYKDVRTPAAESLQVGDYGVVRNHWYKFNITSVIKPGTSVDDPNQPIVPNYDDDNRYIGVEIVVLPWHIVNNGEIGLQ